MENYSPDITGGPNANMAVQNSSREAAGGAAGGAMMSNPKLMAASMAMKVLSDQQKRRENDELNRYKAQENHKSTVQNALSQISGLFKQSKVV